MTTALAPRLTALDERVLRQVPDVGPGIRARHIVAVLNRNLPTYSRNRVDVGDVRLTLRGLEHLGRVQQTNGWWTTAVASEESLPPSEGS